MAGETGAIQVGRGELAECPLQIQTMECPYWDYVCVEEIKRTKPIHIHFRLSTKDL